MSAGMPETVISLITEAMSDEHLELEGHVKGSLVALLGGDERRGGHMITPQRLVR